MWSVRSGRTLRIVTAFLVFVAVPVTADAVIRATSSAATTMTVVSWSAAAVRAGGPATTGPYAFTLSVNDKVGRQGVFDIVNSGTAAVWGFTLSSSAGSGFAASTGVVYDACSVAWALTPNQKGYACGGTVFALGSLSLPDGSVTVTRALAPGNRVFARATASAATAVDTVRQVLSVSVARSQVRAGAAR